MSPSERVLPGSAGADLVETARELSASALASGGSLRLRVNGASMLPLLRPGDVVWVEPVEEAALRLGDVVLVRRAADFVTHRLVERTPDEWIAKGDNLAAPDPAVSGQDILGRVYHVERAGRRIEENRSGWKPLNRRIGRLAASQYAIWKALRHRPVRAARLQAALPRLINVLFRLGRRFFMLAGGS